MFCRQTEKTLFRPRSCPGFLLAVACLAFGLGARPAVAEEIVAKLSYHWSPSHHSAVHAKMFADEVNRRAAGRLRIDLFPSGQLFGIREVLGAVTAGAVQMGGVVGVVSFPPINKNYNIANLPGLFGSYQQQRDFFTGNEVGKRIWSDLAAKSNTRLVMYDPVGPVMTFSAARELKSVEAMNGLKARALFQIERPLWRALQVNAVSLPTREVYTSLQTGMIDTVNSPPIGVKAYSWWEFLKFGQLPYQSFADAYILANGTWYDGLPQDLKDLLLEVGAEMGKRSTDTIMQTAEDILKEFEARGGVVTRLEGDAKAEFDKLMAEQVLPEMSELVDGDVLEAARAFTAK